MESKVNYSVVGFFVVILGVAMIFIFFWLSTMRHGKVYDTYSVYFHEDVTGLVVQSPVQFNGVRVGYVESITLDSKNPQLVKLVLKIEQGTNITTSTVATLVMQGITGVVNVGLKALTDDAPRLKAKPGQEYPVIPAQPSFLMQLSKVLPDLMKTVKGIGSMTRRVFTEKNIKALSATFANLSKFTKTLADNSENLTKILKSLRTTSNNTAKASKDLPNTMKQLNAALQSIKKTSADINKVAKSAQTTMQSGNVAINNFNTQVMPTAQQTLQKLNRMASSLSQISQELERNPSVLVRGRQPQTPGPGEK